MKKLNPRAYLFHKIIDYTGVVLLVGLLLFIWQLYRAPIAVPFLKPYIIKALNHDDADYQVTLDSVNLELVRSIIPVHIIAKNVKYKNNDGSFIIEAPKTSVSFSIKALLRGVIAPSSIEVNNPSVYIFTTYGIEKNQTDKIAARKVEYYIKSFEEFIERFNSSDKSYAESYINDINIKHAEVEFHEVEQGRKWTFSDVNYRFERNFSNIETDINALLKLKDRMSSLGLSAEYRPSSNKLGMQLYFSELIPGDLIANFLISEDKPEFFHIDLPLSGKINALINFDEIIKHQKEWQQGLDNALEDLSFNIEGGQGAILFSDKKEDAYPISSIILDGKMGTDINELNIKNTKLNIDGLPADLSFKITGLKKYLFQSSLEDIKLQLSAKVATLPFSQLSKYWPRFLGTTAWQWCKDSILSGYAKNGDFTFDFAYDKNKKAIAFENMTGSGEIEDGELFYLSGMPNIVKMYGLAEFSSGSINIKVDKAISDGVEVNGGHVRLYDLNKENNYADILLQSEGSVTNILKLIDHQPLGYTSEMGLKPEDIQGTAETSLKLDFELKSNLKPKEVKVDVKAKIKDFSLPDAIDGKPVSAPELDLSVTNEGMLVEGNAFFEQIPLKLTWNEDFEKKDYKSKYKLSFRFDDRFKKTVGISDVSLINAPYISGFIDVDSYITTYDNDKMIIDISGNLKDADVDFSFLGLRKPKGQSGNVETRLNFVDNKLVSIPSFSMSKQDFSFNGNVKLNDDSSLKEIDVLKIKGPKTDARAKISFIKKPQEKVKITVSGTSYDLSELFASGEDKFKEKKEKNQLKADNNSDWENVTSSDINIAVDRLWTNDLVSIKNFAGSAKLVNGIGIHELKLIGNFGNSKEAMMKLNYSPRSNGEYLLSVDSNNAGSTLKVLRLYNYMSGGILNIEAKRNKNKEFIGHAKIRDFSIHNTPVLAKLFTVASFTGMLNLLSGEGMTFSHFDAPFEYKYKTLYTNNAKAFGSVMGITANGTISRISETYDIKGVIAPAYSLNTFIGKIPLVGNLLSGKDGTVFAANYNITGPLSDPNISINPLSALSPSSIKDLYQSIFGGKGER